jgi:hypothetical protein
MARADLRDTRIRAALEGVAAELAVVCNTSPLTRLRISQALQRTGLVSLLDPALDEIDEITHAVESARVQVGMALEAMVK